jgi:hypothetical protein
MNGANRSLQLMGTGYSEGIILFCYGKTTSTDLSVVETNIKQWTHHVAYVPC